MKAASANEIKNVRGLGTELRRRPAFCRGCAPALQSPVSKRILPCLSPPRPQPPPSFPPLIINVISNGTEPWVGATRIGIFPIATASL
jgi:hypothetical protein